LAQAKERIDYWTKANNSLREHEYKQSIQVQELKSENEGLKRQLGDQEWVYDQLEEISVNFVMHKDFQGAYNMQKSDSSRKPSGMRNSSRSHQRLMPPNPVTDLSSQFAC